MRMKLPVLCLLLLLVSPVAMAQFGGAAKVRVGLAEMRSMQSTTLVPGTVVSRQAARLAAEVSGRLLTVLDVGSAVARGETVARIEDTMLRLRNDELVAEVARVRARLEFLRKEEARFVRLAENNLAAAAQLE